MAMNITDLIREANAAYKNGFVQEGYDDPEGVAPCTETMLAALIVAQIEDLFDAYSSDTANLRRVTEGLQTTADDLYLVVRHLQSLSPE